MSSIFAAIAAVWTFFWLVGSFIFNLFLTVGAGIFFVLLVYWLMKLIIDWIAEKIS
ncbi:hypothetical protein SDC9_194818 [bioreactor metagenome]|uniref:Uncharacterized protein n=1 Tax=bioreactor metagenome TaxID=1076179 RepID=A0A645I7A9_9ZZZZ